MPGLPIFFEDITRVSAIEEEALDIKLKVILPMLFFELVVENTAKIRIRPERIPVWLITDDCLPWSPKQTYSHQTEYSPVETRETFGLTDVRTETGPTLRRILPRWSRHPKCLKWKRFWYSADIAPEHAAMVTRDPVSSVQRSHLKIVSQTVRPRCSI